MTACLLAVGELTSEGVALEDIERHRDICWRIDRRHFGELDREVAHVQVVADVGHEGGRDVSPQQVVPVDRLEEGVTFHALGVGWTVTF